MEKRMTNDWASMWVRARVVTRGALTALALTAACGQATDGTQSAAVSDTASAYEALSVSVQSCEDDKDICVTDANGEPTKVAACDAAASSCLAKTQGAQATARKHLQNDAEGCVREGRHHGAGGSGGDAAAVGGAGGASGMGMQGCMRKHAPAQGGQCMEDFFTCLDATGVRESGAQTQLDQATRDAVGKCVDTAHSCMMNDMMARHHGGSQGPRGKGGAGHAAMSHGAAGGHAFPGHPEGGAHAPHADGGASAHMSGPRGPLGAAGAAPGRHMGAGGAGGSH
jgi:hypothetical protein